MANVEVIYYTDPACPWSWAAEPALRRLQIQFAAEASITYVLGGLHREINDPQHELPAALDAAQASGMPVDPRAWGGHGGRAPRSTYPASVAAKAAAEQGLDGAYLASAELWRLAPDFRVAAEQVLGGELWKSA
jgi:predicted DsbA family dithiol-disulfide isomerase